jgi:hypothetical protein
MATTNAGAIANLNSRTIHVAQVVELATARGTWVRAGCGQPVEVRWYEINHRHANVCRRCRKAMGWDSPK